MAAKKIIVAAETGEAVYCIIKRESNGWLLDDTDGGFRVSIAEFTTDPWRGPYSVSAHYLVNDRVSYGGTFYFCTSENGLVSTYLSSVNYEEYDVVIYIPDPIGDPVHSFFYTCIQPNGPLTVVRNPTNGSYWSSTGSALNVPTEDQYWSLLPPFDPYLSFTENSIIKGRYDFSEDRSVWVDGLYTATAYQRTGSYPAPEVDTVLGIKSMYVKNNAEVVAEEDVADISWDRIVPTIAVTVTQTIGG